MIPRKTPSQIMRVSNLRSAVQNQWQLDVLEGRSLGDQLKGLENHSDGIESVLCHFPPRHFVQTLRRDRQDSTVRAIEAGE